MLLHMLLHLHNIPLDPARLLRLLFTLRPSRPRPVQLGGISVQAQCRGPATFLGAVPFASRVAFALVNGRCILREGGTAPALAAVFGAGEDVPLARAVGGTGGGCDESVIEGVGGKFGEGAGIDSISDTGQIGPRLR